jgi:hypothetical protein
MKMKKEEEEGEGQSIRVDEVRRKNQRGKSDD